MEASYLYAKKTLSKTLYEYVRGADIQRVSYRKKRRNKKYQYEYRFINQVPIRDGDDALQVNWLEIVERNIKTNEIIYKNTFVTSHNITDKNVAEIAEAGRTKWKIENENNNTLKTKGYNFEHNYGHGKKHLSSVLASLTVIAFLFHTILGLVDILYIRARQKNGSRVNFYNNVRAILMVMIFESWEHLMKVMSDPPKIIAPQC